MSDNYNINNDNNSDEIIVENNTVYPNPYETAGNSGYYNQDSNSGYNHSYQNPNDYYGQNNQGYQQNGYYGQNNQAYQQNGYYGQNNQGYQQYNPYQQTYVQHGSVKELYNRILMILYPISFIISVIIVQQTFNTMDIESLMTGNYLAITSTGWYATLSNINSLLSLAMTVFFILDIVQIYKQHYNIVGLILFAILLKPGYFLWRAHVLQRPKTGAIIYSFFLGGLFLWYILWIFRFTVQIAGTIS